MSTILKALRRVEGERRQQQETERFHGEVTSGSLAGRRPLRVWLAWALVLGLLGIVAAGLWSWGSDAPLEEMVQEDSETAVEASGLAAAADRIRSGESPPTRRSQSAPARDPVQPGPGAASRGKTPAPPAFVSPESEKRRNAAIDEAVRRRTSAAAGLPRAPRYEPPRTVVPAPPAGSPEPVLAEESAPSKPKSAPEAVSPYLAAREAARIRAEAQLQEASLAKADTPPPASRPVASQSPPQAQPKPQAQAQPQPKPQAQPKPQPPSPVAASAQTVQSAPVGQESVQVLSTVWHPSPSKRVAVVSLAQGGASVELRQGETLNGLRVSEIKLSSVVFERGDQTIVRKVGSQP